MKIHEKSLSVRQFLSICMPRIYCLHSVSELSKRHTVAGIWRWTWKFLLQRGLDQLSLTLCMTWNPCSCHVCDLLRVGGRGYPPKPAGTNYRHPSKSGTDFLRKREDLNRLTVHSEARQRCCSNGGKQHPQMMVKYIWHIYIYIYCTCKMATKMQSSQAASGKKIRKELPTDSTRICWCKVSLTLLKCWSTLHSLSLICKVDSQASPQLHPRGGFWHAIDFMSGTELFLTVQSVVLPRCLWVPVMDSGDPNMWDSITV